MLVSDYDYVLPESLIAQFPAEKRQNSKMMVLDKNNKTIEHYHFYDIVNMIDSNSILVLNDTKVIPARLFGKKVSTGAKIEILLLSPNNENKDKWQCLIKPSKRVKPGTEIKISDELSVVAVKQMEDGGEWLIKLIFEKDLSNILHKYGNIPLPPYIERDIAIKSEKSLDIERYQTVYARDEGSVAAPTAGLHFTQEILAALMKKGIDIVYITLNVGMGTFRPVKSENVEDHIMHSETFEISEEAAKKINTAKHLGKKVVAVGTTSVRTLETAYKKYGCIKACKDSSKLFIYPPYKFNVVDSILTNFHLPKSTLIMLVSAFAGKDFIFKAYHEAIANNYRFFSYGDCMFIK